MPEAIPLVLHRFVLRTQRGPLRPLWKLAHSLVLRAVVGPMLRGQPASAYVRGGFGYGDVVYGLSDIDVSIVVGSSGRGDAAAERRRRRWRRMCRLVPGLRHLIQLAVYDETELARVTAATTLTAAGAMHLARAPRDEAFLRFRPGLFGPLCDWRRVSGPELRPAPRDQDAHERRTAGWLELQRWWREAFFAAAHPAGPRLPYVCVKLVAEPARIWLWLVHGERVTGRREVLERALRHMPDEEPALRGALALHDELDRSPDAPFDDALASFVRLSDRLGRRFAADVAQAGSTSVGLSWGDESELVLPGRGREPLGALGDAAPRLLPLCDWRARAWPIFADDALGSVSIDPTDPSALGAAALAAGDYGPYAAVRRDSLLILPGPGLMRAVQCQATDPVSFALLDGRSSADFPDVPGWSASDSARRAVAEHRAWLGADRAARGPALVEWMEAQARTMLPAGETLGRLLTAAQAGLFLDSIERGEPELPLTMAAVARRLGEEHPNASTLAEEAYAGYRGWRLDGEAVPARVVPALRELVLGLPGYDFATPWAGLAVT